MVSTTTYRVPVEANDQDSAGDKVKRMFLALLEKSKACITYELDTSAIEYKVEDSETHFEIEETFKL